MIKIHQTYHPDLLKLITDKLICPICKNPLVYGSRISNQCNYECLKCNLKTLYDDYVEDSFDCKRLYIKIYKPDYYLLINFELKITKIYNLNGYKQRVNYIPNLSNLHNFVNIVKTFQ